MNNSEEPSLEDLERSIREDRSKSALLLKVTLWELVPISIALLFLRDPIIGFASSMLGINMNGGDLILIYFAIVAALFGTASLRYSRKEAGRDG